MHSKPCRIGVAEIIAVALHFSLDPKVDTNAMLVAHLATATARSSREGANHWNSQETTNQIWQMSQLPPFHKSVFNLMFDLPELRLPTKKAAEALLSAFKHARPGVDFPLESVLRIRRSAHGLSHSSGGGPQIRL
eukprot:g15334.t1